MIEIVPDVLPAAIGEEIEGMLFPNVEGSTVLAKTTNPKLKELTHLAVEEFCKKLGLNQRKTVSVFELYRKHEMRKFAHHLHTDGTVTITLGISSDIANNAGTVAIGGKTSALHQRFNSEVFRLNRDSDHAYAEFNEQHESSAISISQAPRFGALILQPITYHCAPLLPEDTARLLLLYSP